MLTQYFKLPRSVYVLCLGTLINRAGAFVILFLPAYLHESLGLSKAYAALLVGAFGLGALLASLVGGQLADQIGRRAVMLLSLFGAAVVLLWMSTLSSTWALMIACVAYGLIAEMYRPAASAMLGDVAESELRPTAFALMYVAINLGFGISATIGGWLATYSFRWLFIGDAATAAAYGVIILLAIRETLPGAGPRSDVQDVEEAADEAATYSESVSAREAVRHILRDGTFLTFCLASLCLAVVYMQAMTTFQLYLLDLSIDTATFGTIIAINGIMIVVLQLPVTSVASKFNRAGVITLAAVVTAVGFGLIEPSTAVWHFAGTVVIWTLGEIMHAPIMMAVVSDLAPIQLRGRYMGVASMTFSVALMIGPPLGGWVLQRFGGTALWGGGCLLALVAASLYWSIRRRIGPRPDQDH